MPLYVLVEFGPVGVGPVEDADDMPQIGFLEMFIIRVSVVMDIAIKRDGDKQRRPAFRRLSLEREIHFTLALVLSRCSLAPHRNFGRSRQSEGSLAARP